MGIVHHRRKVDSNQQEVIDAFEKLGCHVTNLSAVGQGCPDLLVTKSGQAWFIEVKNRQGRNRLTDAQVKFIAATTVPVHLVYGVQDVEAVIKGEKTPFN